jgi:hypothetical protein
MADVQQSNDVINPQDEVQNIELTKSGKKKYSKGTGRYQKASLRVVKAVSKGLDDFYAASRKSSEERRDGFFRDLPENLGEGLGETLSDLAEVPKILTKRGGKNKASKIVKTPLRAASSVFRFWD